VVFQEHLNKKRKAVLSLQIKTVSFNLIVFNW
jgi:hypothetical protein